jgi:light-regulated signal transduction histidine kinase (bacteriophytochrome)
MESTSIQDRLAEALTENEQLRQSLEACIAARSAAEQDTQRAQAVAAEAKKELQGFLYGALHDVKTALRAVSSYTQLLVRQTPVDEQGREYGRFITEGVLAANGILERATLFSRLERTSKREPMDLGLLVQMALLKLSEQVGQSGAQVRYHDLPVAAVDDNQFVLLFENLIDNAIKYARGNAPDIEIWGNEADGAYVISVRDNGPGIEQRFAELAFEPFKRLHGKSIPGVGLGLAICRKIARAHDGEIHVESDGKNGSVFKVSIPF